MSIRSGHDEGVLQELKRRRVIRVVIAYISVCVGVLLTGGLLLELLGGPPWAFRALLGTAAMGFPVTAVLAWTYDVTPEGIVRTPDGPPTQPPGEAAPEWAWAATVTLGLVVGLISLILRAKLL